MEYLLSLAVFASIYAIAALSLNLLIGQAGIFSVAHATFFGIGAYATGILTTRAIGLFPLALALGTLVAGAAGWVFARATLRVSGDYMVVASFALLVIFSQVFTNWTGLTGGGTGLPAIPRLRFLPVDSAGHLPIVERASIVNGVLLRFLQCIFVVLRLGLDR